MQSSLSGSKFLASIRWHSAHSYYFCIKNLSSVNRHYDSNPMSWFESLMMPCAIIWHHNINCLVVMHSMEFVVHQAVTDYTDGRLAPDLVIIRKPHINSVQTKTVMPKICWLNLVFLSVTVILMKVWYCTLCALLVYLSNEKALKIVWYDWNYASWRQMSVPSGLLQHQHLWTPSANAIFSCTIGLPPCYIHDFTFF